MTLPTVVLVGPHGAGKTTLGLLLAERLGVPFEHELGAELRREALARDPSQHAMLPQERFDAEVMRRELARDLAALPGAARVVETWHPGNLAYAARRSTSVALAYREALREHLAQWRPAVVVQPLTVTVATALARLSEPGPDDGSLVAFFRAVGEEAAREAHGLGLRVLPALATDGAPPEALAERVLRALDARPSRRRVALTPRRVRAASAPSRHATRANQP